MAIQVQKSGTIRQYTIQVNGQEMAEAIAQNNDVYLVEHIVDTLLSKCASKRFVDKYAGMDILQVIEAVLPDVTDDDTLYLSNDRYWIKLSFGDLKEWLALSLSVFIDGQSFDTMMESSGKQSVKTINPVQ